jgi:hypothetical protein
MTHMRGYQCYVGCFVDKSNFVVCPTNACWSMLSDYSDYWGTSVVKSLRKKDIYIFNFSEPETSKYQNFLISIINEITPCEIVGVNGKEYIKFRMLDTYDRSLILLNFIRNLWSEPIPGYAVSFFDNLDVSADRHKDPLARLTWANREACGNVSYYYGHSNANRKASLKIKTTKDLFDTRRTSTSHFLTTE